MPGRADLRDGHNSGIGLETSILFATEGAHVVCADINTAAAEKTVKLIGEIDAQAPRALAVTCDVGKESDIKAMIDKAVQEFGRLDVIFNNAGISAFAARATPTCLVSKQASGLTTFSLPYSAPTRRRWRVQATDWG